MSDRHAVARLVREAAQAEGGSESLPARLCAALMRGMRADAASITFLSHSPARQLLCASDERALDVEELQFAVGEGPCVSAALNREPVTVGDLHQDVTPWPLFGARAREELSRVGAIYAFPLVYGDRVLGSVELLCSEPHELAEEAIEQGELGARAAATALAPLYHALVVAGGLPTWAPDEVVEAHWGTTHLAVDVVVEELGVTPDLALTLMRAHAFLEGMPLSDLAAQILAHPQDWPHDMTS